MASFMIEGSQHWRAWIEDGQVHMKQWNNTSVVGEPPESADIELYPYVVRFLESDMSLTWFRLFAFLTTIAPESDPFRFPAIDFVWKHETFLWTGDERARKESEVALSRLRVMVADAKRGS